MVHSVDHLEIRFHDIKGGYEGLGHNRTSSRRNHALNERNLLFIVGHCFVGGECGTKRKNSVAIANNGCLLFTMVVASPV